MFPDNWNLIYTISYLVAGGIILLLITRTIYIKMQQNPLKSRNSAKTTLSAAINNNHNSKFRNELTQIEKKQLSFLSNCDIIEDLLKKRSYNVGAQYIRLIMPLKKELDKEISNLLGRIEIYNRAVTASHGQTSTELLELERNCTSSANKKLTMFNQYTSKIENLRNKLAEEDDDATLLKILGDELDELTLNFSSFE